MALMMVSNGEEEKAAAAFILNMDEKMPTSMIIDEFMPNINLDSKYVNINRNRIAKDVRRLMDIYTQMHNSTPQATNDVPL